MVRICAARSASLFASTLSNMRDALPTNKSLYALSVSQEVGHDG